MRLTIAQLIGLSCRHTYLSRPVTVNGHQDRVCSDCGARFPHSYQLTDEDRQSVEHYKLVERSVKRKLRLLPWRKKA